MTSIRQRLDVNAQAVVNILGTRIENIEKVLEGMASTVAETAKAIGGLPDRKTDQFLLYAVRSRVSWLYIIGMMAGGYVIGRFIEWVAV